MSATDNIDDDKTDDGPVKKKPPIMLVGLAIVLCAAAGAGGYFIAPSLFLKGVPEGEEVELAEGAEEEAAAEESDHGKKPGAHGAKESDAHGGGQGRGHGAAKEDASAEDNAMFVITGERAYFTPSPLIVSVKPHGRIRHLKISIAVETAPDGETAFRDNALRIKDVLTTYLTAIDPAVLEQSGAIDRIRAQIHKRISLVVAPARVDAVLITDFILS